MGLHTLLIRDWSTATHLMPSYTRTLDFNKYVLCTPDLAPFTFSFTEFMSRQTVLLLSHVIKLEECEAIGIRFCFLGSHVAHYLKWKTRVGHVSWYFHVKVLLCERLSVVTVVSLSLCAAQVCFCLTHPVLLALARYPDYVKTLYVLR